VLRVFSNEANVAHGIDKKSAILYMCKINGLRGFNLGETWDKSSVESPMKSITSNKDINVYKNRHLYRYYNTTWYTVANYATECRAMSRKCLANVQCIPHETQRNHMLHKRYMRNIGERIVYPLRRPVISELR
jgi:hypothetical protein